MDPSDPGCHSQLKGESGRHSQQEGDPDANFSPQEGAFIDDNPSQPGESSQPNAHFSQEEGASDDDIPSQQ